MSRVLQDLLGVISYCYIDDIVVYSRHEKDHLQHLEMVLKKLSEAKLTLKLEKCQFFQTSIKYLGYNIDRTGISCNNSFKLTDCPRPHNVKTLQQFLGLVNYFRKFIPAFGNIARPLYNLLRNDTDFDWTDECETAYVRLKNILSETTTLAHPNYNEPFVLFTDASNYCIGACLAQADKQGHLRPLGYFSKTMTRTQCKYSTTKKEALALVSALKHFQFIITGYPTIVCTDHRPLIGLFSKKLPTDTALARWCLSIQSFRLSLKYYPGKLNVVADYMSRLENPPTLIDIENCPILAQTDGDDSIEFDDIQTEDDCTTLTTDAKPLIDYVPKLEDVSWTNSELIQAQNNDDFCQDIYQQFHGKEPTKVVSDLDKYVYIGRILFKKRQIDDRHVDTLNVVVPSALLNKAIRSVHYYLTVISNILYLDFVSSIIIIMK